MLEYRPITDAPRGTLRALLRDAYAFHPECERLWGAQWREFDDFFYDRPRIADTCGFLTVLDGEPIGFASWDPRPLPAYAEMGHNCIAAARRGLRAAQQPRERARRYNPRHHKRAADPRAAHLRERGLRAPAAAREPG